jgi:predicted nucleic acid-binding protein
VIVVSDTSAISNLAIIGWLDLLHRLYSSVLVPQAVYRELVAAPDQAARAAIQEAAWITVKRADNRELTESLLSELDEGEAEAIALAVESRADLLLIDERLGREVATRLGLRVIGILGVVVEAKRRGCVLAVGPVVDALIHQAGFWISAELRKAVLHTAGEV